MAQTWATRLADVVRGYNMSTQSSTRTSPFFLMHGFHPKVPHNTVKIPRLPSTELDQLTTEDPSAAEGLSRRLEQIQDMEKVKQTVGKNIEVAQ